MANKADELTSSTIRKLATSLDQRSSNPVSSHDYSAVKSRVTPRGAQPGSVIVAGHQKCFGGIRQFLQLDAVSRYR
jgi:hypothetical protein